MHRPRCDEKVNMKAQVEPDAPKTRRFLQYIYGELLDRAPLRAREVVQIRVAENITPVPKIVEMADEGAYGSDIEDELEKKSHRNFEKLMALNQYMRETFLPVAASLFPEIENSDKFDVVVSLAIVNPAKLYLEAEKLGLKIPKEIKAGEQGAGTVAVFSEHPPQIQWLGAIVSIPANSKRLCVCRVMFSKDPGETASWDEIADEIDGGKKVTNKTSWRSVYDAIYDMNKKIEEICGEKLFESTRQSFRRVA